MVARLCYVIFSSFRGEKTPRGKTKRQKRTAFFSPFRRAFFRLSVFSHGVFSSFRVAPFVAKKQRTKWHKPATIVLNVTNMFHFSGCIHTVATEMLEPNVPLNQSKNIVVGKYDYGALDVTLKSPGEDNNKYVRNVQDK